MRTRDRICFQTIRSVRDISRDDRSRIATCSLRTATDRFKANYSVDDDDNECSLFPWKYNLLTYWHSLARVGG